MRNSQKHQFQKTLKSQETDKAIGKRSLVVGSIIATLIAATPFLFYLYESVPETQVWSTYLFTFESHYYENANQAVWLLTTKAIPLFLLFIWFFTCRHWWYHALLVPIAMYGFQLFSIYFDETGLIDGFSFTYFIPIMAIIIPSIYLIRARMFNKLNDAGKTMEELEEEFKVGGKGFFGKLSDYF